MFNADSIVVNDSLKYKTLFNKRTVYGGGGIVPDLFVPMDTSQYYLYYNKLRRTNVVYTYILDYMDQNRETLTKDYPDFARYEQKFEVSDQMIGTLVSEGIKQGIEKDDVSLKFTLPMIKKEVKALIARDLFSRHNFYQIINSDDNMILKAVDIIKNQKEYNAHLASN